VLHAVIAAHDRAGFATAPPSAGTDAVTAPDLVLTVDGGGSSFKATAHSIATGSTVAASVEEVASAHGPQGFAEFDTDRWWRSAVAAMRTAVRAAGRPPGAYIGVTCTGMRIPFVLIDQAGDALAPGVLNVDRRGSAYVDRVRAALGSERLYRLTGHWPNAKLGLPKLLWYIDNNPELWRRVRWVLQFHDWLVFKLCGAIVSEPSSAAMSQLLDIQRRCWADELFAALDLDRALFPELRAAGTEIGRLLPGVAREVGLAQGTPVYVGGGDTHVASLGIGAVSPGALTIVGGSTTPLMLASTQPGIYDVHTGPLVSPHVLPGLWAEETNAGATGILYTWVRDLGGRPDPGGYDELNGQAAAAELGARGITVVGASPRWGEQAWARVAPAAILGLVPGHTRGELGRAVIECNAYAIQANLTALEPHLGTAASPVLFIGGTSRSPFACQVLADVLGRNVQVPDVQEPAAAGGAALITGLTTRRARPVSTYTPDPERHHAYGAHVTNYIASYSRMQKEFGA
jgi:sugar (pentulose or hexulose) kinase